MKKLNFDKLRKEIKEEQKDKPCWNCKHFKGYYFDGVTFECKIEGDNWIWAFVGNSCKNYEYNDDLMSPKMPPKSKKNNGSCNKNRKRKTK